MFKVEDIVLMLLKKKQKKTNKTKNKSKNKTKTKTTKRANDLNTSLLKVILFRHIKRML